jgi:hypothetical protein
MLLDPRDVEQSQAKLRSKIKQVPLQLGFTPAHIHSGSLTIEWRISATSILDMGLVGFARISYTTTLPSSPQERKED